MSKLFKRVTLGVLCAILVACAVAVGTIFGLNSRANKISEIADGNGGHTAVAGSVTITPDNFDTEYDMDGADCAAQAAIWNEAITYAIANPAKTVKITLQKDWIATNGQFGSGTGFNYSASGWTSVSGSIAVPASTNVILDLNGHTIDGSNIASASSRCGGIMAVAGTLEIRDDGLHYDGDGYDLGKITGGRGGYGGAFYVGGAGHLILSGGTLTNNVCSNVNGGAINVDTGAKFTMNGGCIVNNTAPSGGGIFVTGASATSYGEVIINNGTISNNTCNSNGGAATSYNGGGGIYSTNYGHVTINGGDFKNNVSAEKGGFMYANYNTVTVINGGNFVRNSVTSTSSGQGGVVWITGATFTINDGLFESNDGKVCGGVIVELFASTCNLTINGGVFRGNTATAGSAVSVTGNTVVTGGLFEGNVAASSGSQFGGAFFVYKNGSTTTNFSLEGGQIVNNINTGILVYRGASFNMKGDPVVSGNTASNILLYKYNTASATTSGDALINITGPISNAYVGISVTSMNLTTNIASSAPFLVSGSYTNAGSDQYLTHFFADGAPTYCIADDANGPMLVKNSTTLGELTWKYKINGTETTASSNYIECEYGDVITEVSATYNDGSTDHKWIWSNGAVSTSGSATASYFRAAKGNTALTSQVDDAGLYSFVLNSADPLFYQGVGAAHTIYGLNYVFTINVRQKDVIVTINDTTSVYGETINLSSNADTVASDIGVVLTRELATSSIGKYKVTGTWTNKNYNVTFVNTAADKYYGIHEITPLEVTIILHDDEAEYGEKYYTLNKDKNTTLYNNGTADDSTDDWYKGGWRYGDGSNEFYAADMSVATHKYPFELSLTYTKSDGTVVDITNSGNSDIVPKGAYDIVAKIVNKNYDITFVNSDGTESNTSVFTVTPATLKVTAPTSSSTYNKSTYANNDKALSISLPTSEIKGIGNAEVTTATVKYYTSVGTSASPVNPAPTASTTSGWLTSVPVGTIKNAGEYTIYCLITEPNYQNLVYCMTYTVEQQELKYTLTVKHGTNTVNKDANGAYSVTYDATKAVTVTTTYTNEPTYLAADIAAGVGPDIAVYYKGNGANGNYYGTALDSANPDNSGNDENGTPLLYGNSNGPTDGGTYTAVVVNKTGSSSNYKVVPDTGANNTLQFTIDPKTIDKPTVSPTSLTYNGNAQSISYQYDTAAIKELTSANYTSVSEVVSGETKNYKSLTLSSSSANSSTGKTTTAFTATDAGDYAVKFELSSTRNYKWNDTSNPTGAQIIKYTVDKAELGVTLVPPTTSGWNWEADSTGNITASGVTGVINNDAVTFNLSYYKYDSSASGDPTLVPDQQGVEYGDINFDISVFTTEATYYLVIQLADTTVNANYTLPDTDSHFTSVKLEGVQLQQIDVGAGHVDTTNIKWQYKLTESGANADYLVNQTDPDDDTKLVYTAVYNTVTQLWEEKDYIVTVKTSSLPSYLEVDTTYNSDGFVNGYKDNVKSSVNVDSSYAVIAYTASVRLKVKNDSSYTFADGSTSGTATFDWVINKKELELTDSNGESLIKWAFSTDAKSSAGGEKDPDATWTEFSSTSNPASTDNRIYVKISDSYLESLGLDVSNVSVNYNNTNYQTAAKTTKNTTYTITLSGDNRANYSLPADYNANAFSWQISYAQVTVSSWDNTRDVYDPVTDKTFTLPAVEVPSEYEGKVEYTYSYDILDENGNVVGHKDDVDEDTMIADLFAVTDETHPNTSLKIKAAAASGETFDLAFASGVSEECSATIGEMKTAVTVEIVGSGSDYGEVVFQISATYYPDNDTALSVRNFLESKGQYLSITITAEDGSSVTFMASELSRAFEILVNAGTYTVRFEITDEDTKADFSLKKSRFEFVIARKEIVVPQVIKALTFDGTDLVFTDHLDNQYTTNLALIDVTGDTLGRNVISGGYQVTLALNDENYCWVLPASAATTAKGSVKITLATDTVETSVELSSDAVRAVYSWNVAPLTIDSSKMWNNGQLKLTPELATLVNNGDITIKYNYYDTDGMLVGDSESGFDPQGGVSYRIEAVLGGQDGENGNVVFVSSDGTIAGDTSDQVVYTAPKTGMAKFKDALTKKYMGMPLWLWLVIGLGILLFLIILICIIVAAAKKKKKKKEEEAAKAEKEEAKAAAAAAAAAPMLAMSASMADEKAKLEAEKAKMEAELAKAKMEAEAEAAKAKAQAELDLQKAKMEAELAKIRAEAEAQNKQAQQAQQPAQQSAPAQQPVQQAQPQYQQNNVDANLLAELKAEVAALRAEHRMAMPQPQYPQPMYAPQPQYIPQSAQGGDVNAELRARLAEERAKSAEERLFRTTEERAMLAEDRLLRGGYPSAQPAYQLANLPAVQPAAERPAAGAPSDNADVLGAVLASMVRNLASSPALPKEAKKSEPQVIEEESQSGAVNTPTMYPPDAVITTTTTVDTTNRVKPVNGGDRRDESIFDIDGFYDKFDESK